MRSADGAAEVPVPSYDLFNDTEVLGRMAMERMLARLSTRRYPVGLEPVGQRRAGLFEHVDNIKRWRDGTMALRWCAAEMIEAGKQFRRVNGHLHLRSLRDTLERVTENLGAECDNDIISAA